MADGVFDDGLENEAGDKAFECVGRCFDFDVEAIGEADLLDGEITLDDLQLLREGNFFGGVALERLAEDGVEMGESFAGFVVALEFDEGSDGVECVEQEVRLHLHLQCC